MRVFSKCHLFPDTKKFEAVGQDFIGGDLAGDGTQVMQAFADIPGKEFTRNIGLESGDGSIDDVKYFNPRAPWEARLRNKILVRRQAVFQSTFQTPLECVKEDLAVMKGWGYR